jgi:precorrin-6B methylase 2
MQISIADLKITIKFTLLLLLIVLFSIYYRNYLFSVITFSAIFIIFSISQFSGALCFPSEGAVVRKMVDMTGIRKGDVAYDLGSGDARILIEAARRYKDVKLIGVEINPFVALISKISIKFLGLEDRIKIRMENFFRTNLRDADVIFVFLLQGTNYRLEKKLKKELKKGSRIVSHIWKFKDLKLLKADEKLKVYLYKI